MTTKEGSNSRKFELVIGDWGNDGHGRNDKLKVVLYGRSCFTDEDIRFSFQKAIDETGYNPLSFFEDWEDNSLDIDVIKDLQNKFGYKPAYSDDYFTYNVTDILAPSYGGVVYDGKEGRDYIASIEDEPLESIYMLCAIDLLMFFVGFDIDDFQWEQDEEKLPLLVGDFDSILEDPQGRRNAYGYGLYFS